MWQFVQSDQPLMAGVGPFSPPSRYSAQHGGTADLLRYFEFSRE